MSLVIAHVQHVKQILQHVPLVSQIYFCKTGNVLMIVAQPFTVIPHFGSASLVTLVVLNALTHQLCAQSAAQHAILATQELVNSASVFDWNV